MKLTKYQISFGSERPKTDPEKVSEEPRKRSRAPIKCKYCGEMFGSDGFDSRKLLLSHKLSSHKDRLRTSFLAFYIEKVKQCDWGWGYIQSKS